MKYWELVNESGNNYYIQPDDVIFDDGKVCIYYEKLYGEKSLCAAFQKKVFEINGRLRDNNLYLRKEFFVDNLDLVPQYALKAICQIGMKLGVLDEKTCFRENKLDKKVHKVFTVKDFLRTCKS